MSEIVREKDIEIKNVSAEEFPKLWEQFLSVLEKNGFIENFTVNKNERYIRLKISDDFIQNEISKFFRNAKDMEFSDFINATFFHHLDDLKRDVYGIEDEHVMLNIPIFSIKPISDDGRMLEINY